MPNKTIQLTCFGISDIGLSRELNEDVWVAYPEQGLFILADGMGGHAGGEIASKEACQYLYDFFKQWQPDSTSSPESVETFFSEAFGRVNTRIYEEGEKEEELKGMGTTLTALYIHDQDAYLAHVGDSRIYRLRKKTLQQLTEDHSLVNELVALGVMSADELETFPYKHILTRAIGTHRTMEPPTFSHVPLASHDIFLLCSDGLSNYVTHTQMETLLNAHESLAQSGQALVHAALEQGGGDNITLILVDVEV